MFKKYILPLLILFLIGTTGTLITLFKLSPCLSYDPQTFCNTYSSLALILFSLSLTLALTGLFSIIGYLIRWKLYHSEVFSNHFNIALRQGLFISSTVLICMGMLMLNVFRWWSALLILGLIILLEFYFSSSKS